MGQISQCNSEVRPSIINVRERPGNPIEDFNSSPTREEKIFQKRGLVCLSQWLRTGWFLQGNHPRWGQEKREASSLLLRTSSDPELA